MGSLIKRTELSCHTYYSTIDGVLSPQEWINLAWRTGVRAIAITDFQEAAGFGKAARAIEKLRGKTGPGEFDFKVLYGLETVLEDGCAVYLLIQRQAGLEQLYRLLELARQDRKRPFLRKAEINEHRTGLLVGCPGGDGELNRGVLGNLDNTCLEGIAGFYDYLSVLRPDRYRPRSSQGRTSPNEALGAENLILKTIALGKQLGKPVAVTETVRVPKNLSDTLTGAYGIVKDKERDFNAPVPDFINAEEMLDAFSFLEKELAEEIVIHAPNRIADLCEEIRILPEDERRLRPILPGAFETVAGLCREQLQIRYHDEIPEAAQERLEEELAILQSRELDCSDLLVLYHLAQGLRERGRLLAPRGCLAASYVLYLLGVTEADPLALHIPDETLWGQEDPFLYANFNVSEECWEDVTEIFSQMFPQGITVSERKSPDIGRAAEGLANIYTANLKQRAQCANHSCRPYVRFLVPDATELRRWTPVQRIGGKDAIHYDYDGSLKLFRLVLVPAQNLRLLHRLEELTGIPQSSINPEEAVPLLCGDQTNIPKFGTPEAQVIWRLASPKTIEEITKVSSLLDSTDAWEDNAEDLLKKRTIPFSEIIGSRDDVFCRLLDAGFDRAFAYQAMEQVRKGKGLGEECTSVLIQNGIPEWFINSCNKIRYLFPKAHGAVIRVIPALKAAWYKAQFPKEYAQVYSELYVE